MFRKLHDDPEGRLRIEIDGVSVAADPGETIAAVLLRQTEVWSRLNPVSGLPRAPYCMMGVCFECLAEVDGKASVQTCLTPVRDGVRVRRQTGLREIEPSKG